MRLQIAGLVLAGLLLGCGQADKLGSSGGDASTSYGGVAEEGYARNEAGEATQAPAPAAAPMADAPVDSDAVRPVEPPAPGPNPPGGGTTSPVLFLAYTYQIGLELPAARVSGVMERHVRACQDAGPHICQLIGTNLTGDPESFIQGYAAIRGEPGWLRGFMSGIAAETDEAGGRILASTTQSEDLTRQIVDTEARLRALRALRDRLQRLLESRPGRLADLLEVERELARVQGEIDATESNLTVMRSRVAMSELTLNYQSATRPVGSDTFQPLGEAFANFLRIVVIGFAAIITIVAGLLPFAIVLGLLAWAALAWRRRNGGKFWRRQDPPPPAPPERPANEQI